MSRELAEAFREQVGPDDVLVIHDPQDLGLLFSPIVTQVSRWMQELDQFCQHASSAVT